MLPKLRLAAHRGSKVRPVRCYYALEPRKKIEMKKIRRVIANPEPVEPKPAGEERKAEPFPAPAEHQSQEPFPSENPLPADQPRRKADPESNPFDALEKKGIANIRPVKLKRKINPKLIEEPKRDSAHATPSGGSTPQSTDPVPGEKPKPHPVIDPSKLKLFKKPMMILHKDKERKEKEKKHEEEGKGKEEEKETAAETAKEKEEKKPPLPLAPAIIHTKKRRPDAPSPIPTAAAPKPEELFPMRPAVPAAKPLRKDEITAIIANSKKKEAKKAAEDDYGDDFEPDEIVASMAKENKAAKAYFAEHEENSIILCRSNA